LLGALVQLVLIGLGLYVFYYIIKTAVKNALLEYDQQKDRSLR
jgi:hypothetical protein